MKVDVANFTANVLFNVLFPGEGPGFQRCQQALCWQAVVFVAVCEAACGCSEGKLCVNRSIVVPTAPDGTISQLKHWSQVKGQDLREGSRAARDAQQGMRSALGPDYEQRLRREAGPKPDRKARGKHQISSLFHAAKMKVHTCHLYGALGRTFAAARLVPENWAVHGPSQS